MDLKSETFTRENRLLESGFIIEKVSFYSLVLV